MNEEIETKIVIEDQIEIVDPLWEVLQKVVDNPDLIVARVPTEVLQPGQANDIILSTEFNGDTFAVVDRRNTFFNLFDIATPQIKKELAAWALKFNKALTTEQIKELYYQYNVPKLVVEDVNNRVEEPNEQPQADAILELCRYYMYCRTEMARIFYPVSTPTIGFDLDLYNFFFEYEIEVYLHLNTNNKYRPDTHSIVVGTCNSEEEKLSKVLVEGTKLIDSLFGTTEYVEQIKRKFNTFIQNKLTELRIETSIEKMQVKLDATLNTKDRDLRNATKALMLAQDSINQTNLLKNSLKQRKQQITDYINSNHPYFDVQLLTIANKEALVLIYPWSVAVNTRPEDRSIIRINKRLIAPFAFVVPDVLNPLDKTLPFVARIIEYRNTEKNIAYSTAFYYTKFKMMPDVSYATAAIPHAYFERPESGDFTSGMYYKDGKITFKGDYPLQRMCIQDSDSSVLTYRNVMGNCDSKLADALNLLPRWRNYMAVGDIAGTYAVQKAPLDVRMAGVISRANTMDYDYLTDPERVLSTYKLLTDDEKHLYALMEDKFRSYPELAKMVYPNGIKPTNV